MELEINSNQPQNRGSETHLIKNSMKSIFQFSKSKKRDKKTQYPVHIRSLSAYPRAGTKTNAKDITTSAEFQSYFSNSGNKGIDSNEDNQDDIKPQACPKFLDENYPQIDLEEITFENKHVRSNFEKWIIGIIIFLLISLLLVTGVMAYFLYDYKQEIEKDSSESNETKESQYIAMIHNLKWSLDGMERANVNLQLQLNKQLEHAEYLVRILNEYQNKLQKVENAIYAQGQIAQIKETKAIQSSNNMKTYVKELEQNNRNIQELPKFSCQNGLSMVLQQFQSLKGNFDKLRSIMMSMKVSVKSQKSRSVLLKEGGAFVYKNMEKYSDMLRRNTQESSPLTTFFSISKQDSILFWSFDSIKKSFEYTIAREPHMISDDRGGVISMDGIYIVAGGRNKNVKYYNMTMGDIIPRVELIRSLEHTESVSMCFEYDSREVICVDEGGESYIYNNNRIIRRLFYMNREDKYKSGTRTEGDLVLLGGKGKLTILDDSGELIKVHEYSSTNDVYGVSGVRGGSIALTADGNSGCFLHDLINPYTPITHLLLSNIDGGVWYVALVALKSNDAHFGVGGWDKYTTNKGFVAIYTLSQDNQNARRYRSMQNIMGETCCITTIKEVRIGVLLFGGNNACSQICLWNYATLWTDSDFYCWQDHTVDYIVDFVYII